MSNPKKTRSELDTELDKLALEVPEMMKGTDPAFQIDAFAGMAEVIEDAAGTEDARYVSDRLQKIRSDNCLVPSDEGPCA